MQALSRNGRRGALGIALVALMLVAAGCVTGPIPNPPPPDAALAAAGYTEHEYFLDGLATAYAPVGTWASDGRWTAAPATKARFRTRLQVRTPNDPTKFNGTVLVEWLNVSSGADIDPTYAQANAELLRDGYAWVGVSAQKVGVDALRNNPRYASLVHPGDQYSYDIFTQAGNVLRSRLGLDPLGGLHPQHILATGESQSAFRMVTYINAIEPLTHAYDGFLVYSRGNNAAPLGTGTIPASPLFRKDQAQPVIDVQTEGDLVVLRSHLVRQPDDAHHRLWEVAGGSHADEHTLSRTFPPAPSTAGSLCQFRFNSATTFTVVSAAVKALDTWVRTGVAPTKAPRIEVGDPAASDPVVRDSLGFAKGGIRLPDIAVPIALITGLPNIPTPNAPPIFQAFCRLFGRTIPFTDAQLNAMYPTHESYIVNFDRAAGRAVRAGFLLRADANLLEVNAAAQPIPPG